MSSHGSCFHLVSFQVEQAGAGGGGMLAGALPSRNAKLCTGCGTSGHTQNPARERLPAKQQEWRNGAQSPAQSLCKGRRKSMSWAELAKLSSHKTAICSEGHSWRGCLSYTLRIFTNIFSFRLLDTSSMAQDDLQRFLQLLPNISSGGSGKKCAWLVTTEPGLCIPIVCDPDSQVKAYTAFSVLTWRQYFGRR